MDVLSHFNKLSLHTINLLEQKRYIEYQENLNTFLSLFEYSLQNSSNPDNSRLITSLSDNIMDLGKDALNKGFIDETVNLITQLINCIQSNSNLNIPKTIIRISNDIIDLGKQAVNKGFIQEASDVIKALLTYFERNSSSNALKIIDKISDNIIDFGKGVLELGSLTEAINLAEYIIDFSLSIQKDKEIEYKPYLFDLITDIIKTVKMQNDINLIRTVKKFLYKLSNQEETYIKHDLVNYYFSYYFSLSQNKVMDTDEKESLILSLIKSVISDLRYGKENNIEFYKEIIYFLVRKFIENFRYKHFIYLLNELYNSSKYNMKPHIYEIFVTVSIYLYYVSFKEAYYSDIFKNDVKQLLNNKYEEKLSTKETFNLKNFIINSDGKFWEFYSLAKSELSNGKWEYIPSHDSKLMHIEGDLREFFVFYTFLITSSFHFNSISLQKFDSNELRILSEFFEPNHQLKSSYHKDLLKFLEWFKKGDGKEQDMELIVDNHFIGQQILNAYKQSVFENLISYNKEYKKIQKNESLIISKTKSLIENSAFYMLSNSPNSKGSENIRTISILSIVAVPIEYLAEKVHFFNFEPDKIILEQIESEILKFLSSKLEELKFEFNDPKKIEQLFSLIKSLKEQKINIDSLIKDVNKESLLLSYYEDEQNKEILKNFEEGILYLGNLACHRSTLYLDKEMVNIKISKLNLSFRDIRDEDIEGDLEETKIKDDLYRINTTNDVHIELTYGEATKYFKNSYKMLEVKLEVEIFTSEKIGILINYKP